MTEEELKRTFADYDKIRKYIGTNKLSQHIAGIGIPTAIELYVGNPGKLFEVLTKR